jgi:hypothetical protein
MKESMKIKGVNERGREGKREGDRAVQGVNREGGNYAPRANSSVSEEGRQAEWGPVRQDR